ncbi:DNA-primase RepB domain-containing protein [Ovoidimarina sediminis]|uniref:DNA-primase RepB domain-containing protein n=1 Tax=Ovoidimarina sediminis TaxID=3079856 RepID=UPI0029116EE1|nr:DNA-primase RepB domain-containing protein [Rhodophyticola sp. MJ-SS7]MDU8945940.1 DNA-primase RepB domain-containing protein [Rhodophyticola sp. MJ-SS7]
MQDCMHDEARPEDWIEASIDFLQTLWEAHESQGYVFLGTKSVKDTRWSDHSFELPVFDQELRDFFEEHPREKYDIYFCANAFATTRRLKSTALPTRFACVDVDEAPLHEFRPEPTLAWRTSPGRTQGIWVFKDSLPVRHAEQIARNLAYNYGADRGGWSVTKYLRLPYTYNHKPAYDRPEVEICYFCDDPLGYANIAPIFVPEDRRKSPINKRRSGKRRNYSGRKLPTGRKHAKRILAKYGHQLPLMPRSFLGHDALLFPDRSKAIYSIVAGLYQVGAKRRHIEIATWNSVYFQHKYGLDRKALDAEVTRIIEKLEGGSNAS